MAKTLAFLRRHAAAMVAIALLMGGGGVAYGVAGHQGADRSGTRAQQIYACVDAQTRVLTRTTARATCPDGAKKIVWKVTGRTGAAGPAGAPGPAGAVGSAGPAGPAGPAGAAGAAGSPGADGADGDDGDDAVSEFAQFFALAPPDNPATVPPGDDVEFPQDGPTSGTLARLTARTFELPSVGTYRVSFSVPVSEPGQLMVTLNGVELPYTVTGRATGTTTIAGSTLVTTSVTNSTLTIRNPAGNPSSLTITPLAGGTRPVAATLIIEQLR